MLGKMRECIAEVPDASKLLIVWEIVKGKQ